MISPGDAERWRRVKEVVASAIEMEAALRPEWLDRACGSDIEVRREAERLLEEHERTGGVLERPIWRLLSEDESPLPANTRLGVYEILELIGTGGMARVYRATDTRLNRNVAIKVMRSNLPGGLDRQRFEREGRIAASLNHPRICALHDLGVQGHICYLVMEYLQGETLAQRIARGIVPLEEVLRFGQQIAEALDYAHRREIIHRDLKPSNILITPSGVKLLDFGLAKVVGGMTAARDSGSSTMTVAGAIVGTVQYMAPEQLEGTADVRSDMFAFGAVLYEMATGRRAFEAPSQAALVAAIMSAQPPSIVTLREAIPSSLDHLVRSCMAKDPERRYQNAHDALLELEWIADTSTHSSQGSQSEGRIAKFVRARRGWAFAAAVGAPLLGLGSWLLIDQTRERTAEPQLTFHIPTPPNARFLPTDSLAISPSGDWIAFTMQGTGMWMKPMNSKFAQPLTAVREARHPFWSPDGRSIGFFEGGQIKKIDIQSGAASVPLGDVGRGTGGTWNSNGVIVYASVGSPLRRIASVGGESKALGKLNSAAGERGRYFPQFLDDNRLLYFSDYEDSEKRGVYITWLDAPEKHKFLCKSDNKALFVRPGYLLFVQDRKLKARSMDINDEKIDGEPINLAIEPASLAQRGFSAAFSASNTGVLVYRPGPDIISTRLVWMDRSGKALEEIQDWSVSRHGIEYSNPALSPDSNRLAVGVRETSGPRDIWVMDLVRRTWVRFTSHPADEFNPTWSPDGVWIAFGSNRKGYADLYRRRSDGEGEDELLLETPFDKYLDHWSSDGWLIFTARRPQRPAIAEAVPIAGDRKPVSLVQTGERTEMSAVSPDGRWLAYRSLGPNNMPEIYVRRFAPGQSAGPKWRLSDEKGGTDICWRADGREIYYMSRLAIMSVEVRASGEQLQISPPKVLFSLPLEGELRRNRFVVSRDGLRFLVNMPVIDTTPIEVRTRWYAGLKTK